MHALDHDNKPIPGLYLAGSMVGNRFHGCYPNTNMGQNHAGCIVYGRLAGTNAAAKTESWAALQQANANYYGLLSSSDLDTLVSNLELGHDLGPVSLDISAIDTQSLTGYAASTQADDTAAPTDINSADPMLATADTNAVLMELAPPLTRIYAQADYFKQCTVTFHCTGSDSNFYTMLDDLAAQYPSVQLKSVQIDHAAYTNASGATTNTATYTVQLNVILCDKESVVS